MKLFIAFFIFRLQSEAIVCSLTISDEFKLPSPELSADEQNIVDYLLRPTRSIATSNQ